MDKKVIRAKIKLMLERPFWGSLIVRLELKDWDGDTFATEGKHIFIPKDAEKYTQPEIVAILAHETAHCALLHPFRMGKRNPMQWNIAADFTDNALIIKDNFIMPGSPITMAEFFAKHNKEDTNKMIHLLDKKFEGMNTEKVFSMIPPPTTVKISMDVLSPGSGKGKDKKDGKGKKDDSDKSEIEVSAYGVSPKELEQEWKEAVANAVQVAKNRGTLPGGFEEYIEDYLFPKLSWQEILYKYLQVAKGVNDFTAYPFDRRHIWRDTYLPSMTGDMIELCLAVDTSGSISKEDLTRYISEVRGLCSIFGSYIIHFWMCDAAIHGEDYIITEDSDVPKLMIGRGGTDFTPVFKRIEELELEELPVVYFTDLNGSFPNTKRNDVFWIIRKEQNQYNKITPPFGSVIEIDE